MICKDCQVGGWYAARGQGVVANLHHAECRGGTRCDCQHRLEGVNRELLKRQKEAASK